jgi:chorismate mutase/prephenate dehydratase
MPAPAEPVRVAFFGLLGTWTHMAARQVFGKHASYLENATIAEVFATVRAGGASHGVAPIENSTEGGVNQTLDELIEHDLSIQREVVLDISQCLLAKSSDLSAITRVASHPQALAQCRRWLLEHLPNARQIVSSSTSSAAREAASDVSSAAISSPLAAELYGLEVVVKGIQDHANNQTRFVVVADRDSEPTGTDKTSLVFSTAHARGALLRVLTVFDRAGLNLTRIESRPALGKRWEYVFLADLEGHRLDPAVARALADLRSLCSVVKVLGSYPRA